MANEEHKILRPKYEGQRRMLALDGGGIRGLITLGMLEHLETRLRDVLKAGNGFRLCDYFDFIGGTSTGAIIAAGLSIGKSVAELEELYTGSGVLMFKKRMLLLRYWASYRSKPLQQKLQAEFGENTLLGSGALRTLLLIVMKNVSTDSPWPLTNNPLAKYNDREARREKGDCNLNLPLWQLVRASTAAPAFFPPEVVELGKQKFVFVDGGVTPYNNPAFQLYRQATAAPYRLNWCTGEEKMLILSFGSGARPELGPIAEDPYRGLIKIGKSIAPEMMNGMAYDQDINCRVVGRCVFGPALDREVGDLVVPAGEKMARQFTYARYNPELDREGLDELGFKDLDPARVSKLDSIAAMDDLLEIGREYGERNVLPREEFAQFLKA